MREIITILLGHCGNTIGAKFWETITNEHGIDNNGIYEGESDLQLQRSSVYFNHGRQGKFVPRSINVDLDCSTMEFMRNSPIGNLFPPCAYISGNASASNNFAKGYYTDGREIIEDIMELIRLEAENCDVLQGFSLWHSLGGGTGSGLGSLVLNKLREEWPDRIISTVSIMPSPKVSETVVEPYNCILGLAQLTNYSDQTFCLDNEALYKICRINMQIESPSHDDINQLICNAMSGITTCLRFPGQLNTDLRKLSVNMVPFPRLHFLIAGFAPIQNRNSSKFRDDFNIPQLISELFKERNLMTACNPLRGKYFTVASVFRGRVSTKEVEEGMMKCQNKNQSQYVEWIPSNVQTAICDIPPRGFRMSATFVGNNTAIESMFDRIQEQFLAMYRRQAFIHWYAGEGMDKEEFLEAHDSVLDLCHEYRMYQDDTFEFPPEYHTPGYDEQRNEETTKTNPRFSNRLSPQSSDPAISRKSNDNSIKHDFSSKRDDTFKHDHSSKLQSSMKHDSSASRIKDIPSKFTVTPSRPSLSSKSSELNRNARTRKETDDCLNITPFNKPISEEESSHTQRNINY